MSGVISMRIFVQSQPLPGRCFELPRRAAERHLSSFHCSRHLLRPAHSVQASNAHRGISLDLATHFSTAGCAAVKPSPSLPQVSASSQPVCFMLTSLRPSNCWSQLERTCIRPDTLDGRLWLRQLHRAQLPTCTTCHIRDCKAVSQRID